MMGLLSSLFGKQVVVNFSADDPEPLEILRQNANRTDPVGTVILFSQDDNGDLKFAGKEYPNESNGLAEVAKRVRAVLNASGYENVSQSVSQYHIAHEIQSDYQGAAPSNDGY